MGGLLTACLFCTVFCGRSHAFRCHSICSYPKKKPWFLERIVWEAEKCRELLMKSKFIKCLFFEVYGRKEQVVRGSFKGIPALALHLSFRLGVSLYSTDPRREGGGSVRRALQVKSKTIKFFAYSSAFVYFLPLFWLTERVLGRFSRYPQRILEVLAAYFGDTRRVYWE